MSIKKINVTALTPGVNTPSSRFRVRQYSEILHQDGVLINEFPGIIEQSSSVPLISKYFRIRYYFPVYLIWMFVKLIVRLYDIYRANKADIVWLQRELVAGVITLEPFIRKPLVFDVDDAIWTSNPFGRKSMAKIANLATIVIVGNEYLAQWFTHHNDNVVIVPTAIDVDRFIPVQNNSQNDERFIIGWTGSSGNLNYIYNIEDAIFDLMNEYSNIFLKIISDREPKFVKLPKDRIRFVSWTPENEVEELRDLDVGIMPLPDNDFTRGKCSFKMLQYMAMELPVVVSPVGMNADLLRKNSIGLAATSIQEWYDSLSWIYNNSANANLMGKNGRQIVVNEYSLEVVSRKLLSIFRPLVSN